MLLTIIVKYMTGITIAISGILLQLMMLFGRPVYRFATSEDKSFRSFLSVLILLRILWAAFAYWSIWHEFRHPEQWHLDLPGSALASYAAIFPLLILTFDWLLLRGIGVFLKLFNTKFDADAQERRSTGR